MKIKRIRSRKRSRGREEKRRIKIREGQTTKVKTCKRRGRKGENHFKEREREGEKNDK